MEEDISNMRYVELRKKCKTLGLPCNGKKEQLIEVLTEYFKKNVIINEAVSDQENNPVIEDNKLNDEDVEEKEIVVAKKTKGRKTIKSKPKKNEKVVENENESDNKEEVVKTPKRVQSKSPIRRQIKIQKTPEKVTVVVVEEVKQVAPVITEKKGRKGKKKSVTKTPSPPKLTQPEPIYTSTQIDKIELPQPVPPKIINQQKLESSLLTNDESSKNLNVTNDLPSTPVKRESLRNKRASSLPNKTEILDKTYEKIEVNKDNEAKTVEDTNVAASANNNKHPGGARIVKPTVNGIEIRETTAGPRIVKPPMAVEEKKPDEQVNKKKAKTAASKPDFKALHKKLEEKMESIDDHAKRIRGRHEALTITTSTVANDGRIIKAIPIINESPIANKTEDSAKAKIIRRSPSAPTASSIPKIIKSNKPPQVLQQVPATPKTPTSAVKSIKKTTPTSALRKIYNQTRPIEQPTQHISRHLNSITNNLNTSSVQSSAFSRRKSFDINASLAKPLSYQPHIGKIKPLDPAKVKLQQQMRRQSILNNKGSKGDMLHDQLRLRSVQNDDKVKVNQLKSRLEKRHANQMQRRAIGDNEDSDE